MNKRESTWHGHGVLLWGSQCPGDQRVQGRLDSLAEGLARRHLYPVHLHLDLSGLRRLGHLIVQALLSCRGVIAASLLLWLPRRPRRAALSISALAPHQDCQFLCLAAYATLHTANHTMLPKPMSAGMGSGATVLS